MKEKARTRIFIEGRVQGVFFRENTRHKADELGVLGWVRNLQDGGVEMILEGEKQKIEEIIKWLKQGPKFAKVEKINTKWEEPKDEFQNFEVRYD